MTRTVPLPRLDDVAVMRRIVAGDPNALAEVYDRYHQRAYHLAQRICRDHGQAETVVQETFLSLWRDRAYDPDRGRPGPWILTIARYRALDALRAAVKARQHEMGDERIEPAPGHEDVPGPLIAGEASAEMSDRLRTLPGAQREIVCLAYFGQLSGEEIAEMLDLPLGTVKSRMRLALAKLRRAFEDVESRASTGLDTASA